MSINNTLINNIELIRDSTSNPVVLRPSSNFQLTAPLPSVIGTKIKYYIKPSSNITFTVASGIKIPTNSAFTSAELTSGKTTVVQIEHNGIDWMLTSVVGEY